MRIFPIRITMKCPYCGQQDKVALDTRIRTFRCEWDYTIPLVPVNCANREHVGEAE